jgi:hypothetical protein
MRSPKTMLRTISSVARDRLAIPLLLALGLTAAGCGSSFKAATPPGFVELEDQEAYDYRATTADGLVIAVREVDHEPTGELSFWARAIENHLRQRGGYSLIESRDVKNAAGLAGKQLRFGHDEGSKPHLYYVTIFLTDSRIFLLEAGGTKELMTRHAPQIDWAVQRFQAK